MRIFMSFSIVLLLGLTSAWGEAELRESDFSFSGPLGSEGTSIARKGPNHFEMTLGHAPNHNAWANKAQFTLTNAKGKSLRLDVTFPGKAEYYFNEYFYSWSYDAKTWTPILWEQGYQKATSSDTLVFPVFEQDTVYVGHQVPMSYEDLCGLIQEWSKHPCVTVASLGQSTGGRDLWRITITDPKSPNPPSQRWSHYVINLHPGEHNAQWRMAGMIDWLLSDAGADARTRMICHFVPMSSPDAPSKGWYRVNVSGVDMNRSYFASGSDAAKQTHEAYLAQRDVEQFMASETPITTLWGMHTWQALVEPILCPGPEMGTTLGPWTELRDIMERNDATNLIKPLATAVPKKTEGTHWDIGPHLQFGISTFLCEGAGSTYTRQDNTDAGAIIMKSLAAYYKGVRTH